MTELKGNCEDCDYQLELWCDGCDTSHSKFKQKTNVVDINGEKVTPQTQKELVEGIKKDLPMIIEYMKINAQVTRENYLALLKNNFTEQQALHICSNQPLIKLGGN